MKHKCVKDDRFWLLDFNIHDHEHDLLHSITKNEITCIVDEDAGGIVAYVLCDEGYVNMLVDKLNA